MITKSIFDRAFATLQDKLLDALESSAGMTSLHGWLVAAGDIKRPLLIGLFFAAAAIVFSIALSYTIEGTLFIGEILLVWSGFVIYAMLLFVVLPIRLSRCQFNLHVEDPASTEVLAHWSGMMNYAAYAFAFLLATDTLFSVTMQTFRLESLIFIIPTWLPLIALFVVNQMAMSRVIKRSKGKSLNQVKDQMAVLRQRGDPPDNETMQNLMRLWDYYDRIKGTRNSVLDVKGILNLINTLLIPLVAFLLANRAAIFEFLGW